MKTNKEKGSPAFMLNKEQIIAVAHIQKEVIEIIAKLTSGLSSKDSELAHQAATCGLAMCVNNIMDTIGCFHPLKRNEYAEQFVDVCKQMNSMFKTPAMSYLIYESGRKVDEGNLQ